MQSDILIGMNKLVKPGKVPIWNKEITFAVYLKALEAWMEQNKDISEHVRFQDVIESLKMNKDVNGLAKYVGEHILPVLDTVEMQTVMQVVGIQGSDFFGRPQKVSYRRL